MRGETLEAVELADILREGVGRTERRGETKRVTKQSREDVGTIARGETQ